MIKQVIVFRGDLKVRKGKLAAQVAHASMKVFFDRIVETILPPENPLIIGVAPDQLALYDLPSIKIEITPQMLSWIQGKFTKIVVACPDLEAMLRLEQQAKELGLPNALITDSGATEFNGVPTVTALAIGPAESDIIDKITGELPLL